MKLATFAHDNDVGIGLVTGTRILNCRTAWKRFGSGAAPTDMLALIADSAVLLSELKAMLAASEAAPNDPTLWLPLADVRLMAPIPRPSKNVFCVGRNYKAHIEEGARARGREVVFPAVPEFFSKPPTAVVGDRADIRFNNSQMRQLDYEVELAIIIGRTARDIPVSVALDAIFGYTIVNDVTARDLQVSHGQWFKGKSLDSSCPMGPWIVTRDEFGDPSGHRISLRVNGEIRQNSNTSDMLFDCAAIVASLSEGLTLEPGDIIATGTPSGVALGMSPQVWLKPGDRLEAEVEGIGILHNTVAAWTN